MRDYHEEIVTILDFGSQYTQLIARKVRELGVYCEILPFNAGMEKIRAMRPVGIILSGGPSSVTDADAPRCDPGVFDLDVPILGICYGIQLIAKLHQGEVQRSDKREYGRSHLYLDSADGLLEGMADGDIAWMSHGDSIIAMPPGFMALAHSENSPYAAIRNAQGTIYGVQFHPEVHHTPKGKIVLKNFLYNICKAKGLFSTSSLSR
jgi:GMP synthase (glutamine-hydrolysing)